MSRALRPLEAHEVSYLLAQRIQPGPPAPEPRDGLSEAEWAEVVMNTPMGWDPAAYAPHYRMMRMPIGARA